ncbi:MAG TPA: hypothetical protein VLA05_00030 [Coriobacteriia bacterium]|nr:hypothetical protein [Coriobacteriia bacterium]
MKWTDYDFPERFQERAAAVGEHLGAYVNSNGSTDLDEWVEFRMPSKPEQVFEVRASTQAAPELGIVVIWGEAGFQGAAPLFGVRPFAIADTEDEGRWRQRLGNFLLDQVRRL